MKRRTNPSPKVKAAKAAKAVNQGSPFQTTQEVLEDMVRHIAKARFFSDERIETIIDDFKREFPGPFNFPPVPKVIAEAEHEKRRATAYIRHFVKVKSAS